MAMIVNREGIKTLDQARDLIAQIIETLEINKAEGSIDAMLWEFMDKNEFGYCADCDPTGTGEYVHVDDAAEHARENYSHGI